MTIQSAFQFLVQYRDKMNADNGEEIFVAELTVDDLVKQGEAAGFSFTADELRSAFKHDWAMRWQQYQSSP